MSNYLLDIFLSELPITCMALILAGLMWHVKDLKKGVLKLEESIEGLKEEKVWKDVYEEVIKGIERRLESLERKANGRTG